MMIRSQRFLPEYGRRRFRLFASQWFSVVLLWSCFPDLCHAQPQASAIQPAADAPQPLDPAESQRRFKLPADLRVELVACEPLIADPAGVVFDHEGRMFVCELHGYNLEGHFDILELNKTGELDRQVRRIRASDESLKTAREQTYGVIKRLIDDDGDGRMDRAVTWAEGLPACYGMVPARGGLIAVGAPSVIYLADRDADDRAEVRETLLTGFRAPLLERGINTPRWGLDNWIYVAAGGGGGTISGPNLEAPVELGHTDFRFRADGSAIEPVTGACGTFGLAISDFGDRFINSTSLPVLYAIPLPHRYLARNPFVPSPPEVASAIDDGRVFPTSRPHPWRVARGSDPQWVKFYGERETSAGNFTSGCGAFIYRADALPEAYRGNHFCCEPSQNLIHRSILERDGSGYRARRAPGEETTEFLTSTDQWFRPIQLELGPDGAIYVVDMYREIIEDYSAIPRYLQQQYGLIEGRDRGRIWKIRAAATAAAAVEKDPDLRTAGGRLEALGQGNAWWRETAQRLLVESRDRSLAGPLTERVRQGTTPQARLHALETLDGLDALRPDDVLAALRDPHYGVRVHALQLSEKWLHENPPLHDTVLSMIRDPDPSVRLQAALSLGALHDPRAIAALADLAVTHPGDRWLDAAIVSSVTQSAAELLVALSARMTANTDGDGLLEEARQRAVEKLGRSLASSVGARREETSIGRLLELVVRLGGGTAEPGANASWNLVLRSALLEGLGEGLTRTPPAGPFRQASGLEAIQQLLRAGDDALTARVLQIAGRLQMGQSPEMSAAWKSAAAAALDETRPLGERTAAVRLLEAATWKDQQPLALLVDPRRPIELQHAAVRMLAAADDPAVPGLLLANWRGLSPPLKQSVLDAIFARKDRLADLVEAIEQGAVELSELSALRRAQLAQTDQPQLRERVQGLIARAGSLDDRQQIIDQYQAALSLPADASRGAPVFEKQCAKCHRLQGVGFEVGPDLATARSRSDATLLADVLDPSAVIHPDFVVYNVATHDGHLLTGVLTEESATSLTLRKEQAASETVLRREIERIESSTRSLMPDGMEKEISPQDLADLIAYIRSATGTVLAPGEVLFDEQSAIVDWLTSGDGTASLCKDDRFAGDLSLRVTPLQRHSPRIPGWTFRVAKDPGPDTFRYLRFAWKSIGAEGVMLELADNGAWPPAERPLRRYVSGRNTSGWQAREVSSSPPGEWTVVTVDLWQDFGEFTLTGFAPTAMGGPALFDRIELLRSLEDPQP